MVVISASDLLPTMASSMKWPLKTGMFSFRGLFLVFTLHFRPVTNADYPALEKVSESAIKEKQKFERLVVSKEKLLEMFNVGPSFGLPTFHFS